MDTTPAFDESKANPYRSLVGALFTSRTTRPISSLHAKTLAASVKNPTVDVVPTEEGDRLSQKTECQVITLRQSRLNSYLLSRLNDEEEVSAEYLLLEFHSDSDWGGSSGCKSPSSAAHFLAGNCIHTPSRRQKVISLFSAESDWYAALVVSIGALYLRHILEHPQFNVKNILGPITQQWPAFRRKCVHLDFGTSKANCSGYSQR